MGKGGKKKKTVVISTIHRPAQEPSPEGTVEPGPAEDCDVTIPYSEQIVAPKPIPEEGSEVVEPAAAEECEASSVPTIVCNPGITEYVQPVNRYVTTHSINKKQ